MGKPSFVGKKKFIEEVDKKMKSRQEVLAEIARDRIKMKGENEQDAEKVEMIISDSDDQHQKGIWSEDQGDSDDDEGGIVCKSLNEIKWTPKLEVQLEEILVSSGFDFNNAAKEFCRVLNRDEATTYSMFKFDGKALQLKWTDIEIRRHVIPKMNS